MAIGSTEDLPKKLLVTVLRARLTDHNSASRVGAQWIYPNWPKEDLVKNSYPRISVSDINMTSEVIAISRKQEYVWRAQIDVWCWGDPEDPMILTIGGSSHSGSKLLDRIAAEVVEAIESNISDFNNDAHQLHNPMLKAYIDRDEERKLKSGRVVKLLRKVIEYEFTFVGMSS